MMYFSSGQHRGNENEGQLHINERNINQYNKHYRLINYY